MKSYLITDPSFYTSNPKILEKKLLHVDSTKKPDFICLRDKITTDFYSLAKTFSELKLNAKKVLHSDYKLAFKLGFWGVHLPSNKFEDIKKAKDLSLHVVVSTHSLEEALHVEKLGADFITFSPVFFSPNKGKPKGLEKLKEINDKIYIKCFALGGIIEKKQVELCEQVGVYGFASIRYFT
ncbi:thiamine phosphate synthase [Sulfurospirillum sp. 1307]|jgi:thiamine-phosphate pyrophosphorylase